MGFLYGSAEYPIEQMTNTELWRKVQVCQHALDTIGKVLNSYHIISVLSEAIKEFIGSMLYNFYGTP